MTKKKRKPKGRDDERAAPSPAFGGFKPLAAGLADLKVKVDEQAKRDAAAKGDAARRAPGIPARARSARADDRSARSAGDPDDELTFHRMMSGVVPLEGRGGRVPVAGGARVAPGKVTPADLRDKARAEAKDVLERLHHLVDDAVRFEVTDDGRRVEGRRADVPPSVLRALRRGVLPIDARLDLHGLGAEDARERLLDFLRAERTRGERCVLVIHGKGDHSPAGGVLRGEIAAWLSQGRARAHVAAFATAREDDGGEGAVYVALHRA